MGLIVEAGEIDEGLLPGGAGGWFDALDKVAPGRHLDDRARMRLGAGLRSGADGLVDHGSGNVAKVSKDGCEARAGEGKRSAEFGFGLK
ncbi:MAG: hypothetical protein EXQ52_13070 [Bryobacterales bacterium]|nr:hypothetical protein [Bryobacterales bacterium]